MSHNGLPTGLKGQFGFKNRLLMKACQVRGTVGGIRVPKNETIFEWFSMIIYYAQKGSVLKPLLQKLVVDFCSLKAFGLWLEFDSPHLANYPVPPDSCVRDKKHIENRRLLCTKFQWKPRQWRIWTMPTTHNGLNKLDLARILEKSSNLSSLDIALFQAWNLRLRLSDIQCCFSHWSKTLILSKKFIHFYLPHLCKISHFEKLSNFEIISP